MSLDPVKVSSELSQVASPPRVAPWRIRRLGVVSIEFVILAVALEVLAIAIGSGGAWGAATILAWFVIGFFVVAFVLGVVAVLTRTGRRFGFAAAILSLVANPLTLVGIFSVLGSKG